MIAALCWGPVLASIGLCVGSFTTTAAMRAARGEPFLGGRSHCDHCGADVSLASATPLVGYALHRGCCASCGGRIDPIHVGGEVVGALALAAPLLLVGGVRGGLIALLASLGLASSVYDLKTQRLPDELTAGIAVCAGLLSAMRGVASVLSGLGAALAVLLILAAVRSAYWRLRNREGLGFGDVKLLAALALWLGLATPWALAGAATLAIVASVLLPASRERLAFGPYLVAASVTAGLVMEMASWPHLP